MSTPSLLRSTGALRCRAVMRQLLTLTSAFLMKLKFNFMGNSCTSAAYTCSSSSSMSRLSPLSTPLPVLAGRLALLEPCPPCPRPVPRSWAPSSERRGFVRTHRRGNDVGASVTGPVMFVSIALTVGDTQYCGLISVLRQHLRRKSSQHSCPKTNHTRLLHQHHRRLSHCPVCLLRPVR